MEKVMAVGFLFLFCVAFLVIEESSGALVCIPGVRLPVSAVVNFTALSCFYKIIHGFFSFLFFDISRAWPRGKEESQIKSILFVETDQSASLLENY